MEQLVEVIAKALVSSPDEVEVMRKEEPNAIILKLHVAPKDMGKVIGKQGRIAKAIRNIVKAASANEAKKVIVDILDD